MSTATKERRHPRCPDYPPRVIEFARRLAHEGEYTPKEVRLALAKRGFHPARNTILHWVDPDYAEATRRGKRRGGRPGIKPRKTWRRRMERIEELRALRVSYRSIADIMSHDFDLELTEFQVRAFVSGQVSDRAIKRALWPEGATNDSQKAAV